MVRKGTAKQVYDFSEGGASQKNLLGGKGANLTDPHDPLLVSVSDSLNDNQITVRERDSMEQERIPMAGLVEYLRKKLER